MADLLPCPFCGGAMQPRHALWPSEGDTDGIIHASPTDCPMPEFSVHVADNGVSVAAAWNRRSESERLRAALKPFSDYVDPRRKLPADTQITRGSPFSRGQLTMGDCYRAADALANGIRSDG